MWSHVRPYIVAVFAGALCAACTSQPKTAPPPVAATAAPTRVTGTQGVVDSGPGRTGTLPTLPSSGPLSQTRILFDYDSAEIKPEYAAMLAAHARLLSKDPVQKARLEGNTDDRGSPEYNVALGERRAQAVKRALVLHGASEQQVGTVSYGAERPAVQGDDETAWAQNRRVDLVYLPRP
jgi:peptidoglycan-associated lipoprotein